MKRPIQIGNTGIEAHELGICDVKPYQLQHERAPLRQEVCKYWIKDDEGIEQICFQETKWKRKDSNSSKQNN